MGQRDQGGFQTHIHGGEPAAQWEQCGWDIEQGQEPLQTQGVTSGCPQVHILDQTPGRQVQSRACSSQRRWVKYVTCRPTHRHGR